MRKVIGMTIAVVIIVGLLVANFATFKPVNNKIQGVESVIRVGADYLQIAYEDKVINPRTEITKFYFIKDNPRIFEIVEMSNIFGLKKYTARIIE